MAPLTLGAFTLAAPLGRGGMGEVWSAAHRDGTPAAIKVVGQAQVRTPVARRALRNEIRTIAGLDHPAIVAVYDAGTVDDAADLASAGSLASGSPWVAMELCSEGSLLQCPPPDWPGLRGLLLTLLDALAHVHARGLVHRDLKPANVLRCGLDAPRPGWRLADFGVARVLHGKAASRGSTGTPRYMAPEQIRGELWRLGPASDLFSLGCVAWEQAAGRSHRQASSLEAMLAAQASEPLPPLTPRMAVPDGLAAWIDALTRLEPEERPQTAVETARALLALGDAASGSTAAPQVPEAHTFSLTAVLQTHHLAPNTPDSDSPRPGPAPPRPRATDRLPPWPLPSDDAVALRLGDAGLGLLPYRAVPLVGRRALQDRLWASLAGPVERGSTEVVWLRGPSGTGKSRLARWVLERAAELGLGLGVRVRSAGPRANDLANALARLHGTEGQDRDRTWAILKRQGVDPDQAAALATWWVEGGGSPAEHASLASRRIAALAGRRGPLVVWLDDVHHRRELRLLVDRLVQAEVPALVVFTTDDEATAGDPIEAELQALVDHAGGWSHGLDALQGTARYRLVQSALGLEPALAADVAAGSAGNPGLALAMMHRLVAVRGLRWTAHGFGLAPGARRPTVQDSAGVWRDRLAAASTDLSDAQALAVAAGAVVGSEVDPKSWTTACAALKLEPSQDALESLARAALVHIAADGGWSFLHGAARQAALAALSDPQRHAVHHALAEAATDPDTRARHLLAIEAWEEALEPLVDAGEASSLVGDQNLALRRMEQWQLAAERVGLARSDPRRLRGLVRLAGVRRQVGQLDAADALSREVLTYSQPATRERAFALSEQAGLAGMRGEVHQAMAGFLAAAEAFDAAGEARLAEGCRVVVVNAHVSAGQYDQARSMLDALVPVDAKSAPRIARCHAVVAMFTGDFASARTICLEALEACREAGYLHGIANAHSDLGSLEMKAGNHDDALAYLTTAADQWRALGSYHELDARLNVAQMHGERGNWTECRANLAPVLAAVHRSGTRDPSLALAVALSAAAGLGDWPTFDLHLDALRELVTVPVHIRDVQLSMRAAERLARSAGHPERADTTHAVFTALDALTRVPGTD